MTVNDGFQVGITRELFKGHVTIPEAEKVGARFTSEYFFAGGVGPKTKHLEKTPTDNDFVADDGAADTVWSECGATTLFRVNAALIAHGDGASISLYTCDASDDHGLAFNVSVRACDSIERK
ncbi:TPA: hypothetical protein N0F65_002467 [Lagenidium giganteum]|uniref:Uncharacterized protein n=1 Tax=Lagenidium giganteum TaxID=4803 RepID=A0AAV2YNJ7_9STRA|nr:TPA: hypothetical protein N0F65_002467 [Lagenidium giganteum]